MCCAKRNRRIRDAFGAGNELCGNVAAGVCHDTRCAIEHSGTITADDFCGRSRGGQFAKHFGAQRDHLATLNGGDNLRIRFRAPVITARGTRQTGRHNRAGRFSHCFASTIQPTPGQNSLMTRELEAGSVVLITGAGMGMGELYAHRAAQTGAAGIALWDINREQVERVAADLTKRGVTARAYVVNIADREAVAQAAEQTLADFGHVDVLINNAGVVRGKRFWEHDSERDIEFTMQVNALAPMWITRAFLPSMMTRGHRARILNIASAAGTLANPGMSVYASSKWAMIGWSESLRLELEADNHPQITVTTFCPSYISTGMFAGARGPLLTPIMTPEKAVTAAWNGMMAGAPMVTRPWTVKLAMALRGVLPTRAWDAIAGRVFHVYSSMDKFTGRPGSAS